MEIITKIRVDGETTYMAINKDCMFECTLGVCCIYKFNNIGYKLKEQRILNNNSIEEFKKFIEDYSNTNPQLVEKEAIFVSYINTGSNSVIHNIRKNIIKLNPDSCNDYFIDFECDGVNYRLDKVNENSGISMIENLPGGPYQIFGELDHYCYIVLLDQENISKEELLSKIYENSKDLLQKEREFAVNRLNRINDNITHMSLEYNGLFIHEENLKRLMGNE